MENARVPAAAQVFWLADVETGHLEHLSDGCEALFGCTAEHFREHPDALFAMLQLTRDELRQLAGSEPVREPDRVPGHGNAGDHEQTGALHTAEFQLTRADGRLRWIHSRVFGFVAVDGRQQLAGFAEDITQQRIAQVRVQESEELLNTAEDIGRSGSWDWDLIRNTSRWSRGMFRLFEIEPARFAGDPAAAVERIHPDDRPVLMQAMAEVLNGRTGPGSIEYRIVRKDGQVRHLMAQGRVIRDEREQPIRHVGTVRDVTEQRRAEAALRRSEESLARAQRIARLGSWEFDIVRGQIELSDQIYRIWGMEPGGFIPTYETFLTSVHPGDQARVEQAIEAALIDDVPFSIDHRIVLPTGEERIIHEQGEVRRDAQGNAVYMHGIAHDVTEWRQAEVALRESEARFRTLVEHASEAIVVLDLETDRFVDANENALRMFRYPRDMFLRIGVMDLTPETQPDGRDSASFSKAMLHQALAGGSPVFEWTHRDSTGRAFPCEVRLVRLPPDSKSLVRGAITDITERKRAKDAREALISTLEAQKAELERFTYTVSHDLKGPLITVKGFLGVLHKAVAASDLSRVQDAIDRITRAVDRMHRLLSDLLELSRIGRVGGAPAAVPLSDVVREVIELVSSEHSQADVSIQVASDLPVVHGDRTRLSEVFQNLLENAVRFCPPERPARISIGKRQQNGATVLYVCDNGIGIAPAYHDKVFGLFEQLDPKSGGTGVGLAIVKRIIDVHGGRIWIESEGLDQGTTVCFTLPETDGH